MSGLRVFKHTTAPVAPYAEGGLYLINKPSTNVHKAFRLAVLSVDNETRPHVYELDFDDGGIGTTFGSPAQSGTNAVSRAFDGITSTFYSPQAGTPAYLGKIYTTPRTVPVVLVHSADDDYSPGSIEIQYSDDTTTGFDGTWTAIAAEPDMRSKLVNTIATFYPSTQQGSLDSYLSSEDGQSLYKLPSKDNLDDIINQAASSNASILQYATIADRDADIGNIANNIFVEVADASDDPDVNSGKAMYIFDLSDQSFTLYHVGSSSANIEINEW